MTFGTDQRSALKSAALLPANVSATMDAFDNRLTDEQRADPAFGYRVAFVPKVGSKASKADLAIEFVKPGTEVAKEISRVLLKEVDKTRYTAGQVDTHAIFRCPFQRSPPLRISAQSLSDCD